MTCTMLARSYRNPSHSTESQFATTVLYCVYNVDFRSGILLSSDSDAHVLVADCDWKRSMVCHWSSLLVEGERERERGRKKRGTEGGRERWGTEGGEQREEEGEREGEWERKEEKRESELCGDEEFFQRTARSV